MPSLLLHLTIAKRVAEAAPNSLLATAARAEPAAYLLGSILPDLPYHAHFWQQSLRHVLKRAYLRSSWGDIYHTRGTGRLVLSMITHLRRSRLPAGEQRLVLALIAGYLCHHAYDMAVHPVINTIVDGQRRSSTLRNAQSRVTTREASRAPEGSVRTTRPYVVLHVEAERYQSLFYHHDLMGHDVFGTPYPRQLAAQTAASGLVRPAIPDWFWDALRAACLETHACRPPLAEVRDWMWGITVYCHLMSTAMGRAVEGFAKGADLDALRTEHYQGPTVDLATPLQAGEQLTFRHWGAAIEVIDADRIDDDIRAVFLQRVPDVDLGTGS